MKDVNKHIVGGCRSGRTTGYHRIPIPLEVGELVYFVALVFPSDSRVANFYVWTVKAINQRGGVQFLQL